MRSHNLTIKLGLGNLLIKILKFKCEILVLTSGFAAHMHLQRNQVQLNVVLLNFRLKGLLCEGSEESPILHLRLLEPYETFEEDEEKLKQVVANVSSICVLLSTISTLAAVIKYYLFKFYHQIKKEDYVNNVKLIISLKMLV